MDAPQWLIDRMDKLKKLPPPTLEEVKIQLEASERFRAVSIVKERHIDTVQAEV